MESPYSLQDVLTTSKGVRVTLLPGTYTGDFTSSVQLAMDADGATIDGSLYVDKDWTIIKNLHIKDADFLDRISEIASGSPDDIGSTHDGLRTFKNNILIQDCIIENCRQGFFKNSTTTNLVLDGCILFHNGWLGPDRPHGHGIYAAGRLTTVRNCISFSNFEFGIKVYDEGLLRAPIDDCTVEDNIAFGNSVLGGQVGTRGDILFGHNDQPFYRPIVRRNYTYQLPEYVKPDVNGRINTNWLGYKQPFYDAVFVDNYMPNNCIVTDELGSTFEEIGGNITEPEKENKVVVIPVRDRLHVAIYNWQGLDAVKVAVPFKRVRVRNVQDYFEDVLTLEAVGGVIEIPMTGHTVAAPVGWTAPATVFPTFGCFILIKQ